MIGKAMLRMTCNGGSTTPCGRSASTRSSGTKTSFNSTSLLAVPRMPIASHVSTTWTPGDDERNGHVQHAQASFRVVVGEHRRHDGAGRRLADEDLASGHAIAAVGPNCRTSWVGEIGTTGRHQHDAVVVDPSQGGFGAGQPPTPAPRRERRHVLVHARREGCRSAVLGQFALHRGEVADRRAGPAELGGHAEGEQAALAQVLERVANPGAIDVVATGVRGELRPAGCGQGQEVSVRLVMWSSRSAVMQPW